MRLQLLASALALAMPSAAFSDSYPLILVSTSAFPDAPTPNQIQTSSSAIGDAKSILASCPTDRYLLVMQPGINSAELAPGACAMPHLCRAVEDSRIQGKFIVSEVVGSTTLAGLESLITSACGHENKHATVEELRLPPLHSDRAQSLASTDDILARALDGLTSSESYTILFVGDDCHGDDVYLPDFDDNLSMDLKRDLRSSPMRRDVNGTERDRRPLFEKYQFFTPGIFMAIITAIVLFSILFVGLKALASLEVSYGAFEKDMGPAAQKKQ
ncbi:hypothetical protein AK830_g4915 [Neonectria ditissima]|uniref:Protein BIG1 n=1 Tax=Neonectria ditissima TaxID=78410 RepID=A0A0P7BK69_9HYPO|nr:hypothetical protein AK830_g4915 [Neonectria ditissima]